MRKTQQKHFDSDIKNIYSPKKSLNSAIHFIKSGFLNLIFNANCKMKSSTQKNKRKAPFKETEYHRVAKHMRKDH